MAEWAHRPVPAHALTPLTGTETLRLSSTTAVAGQHFSSADPLAFEFQVPAGEVIVGAALPPDALDSGGALADAYPRALDESVIQLEVPAQSGGKTDEDDRYVMAVGAFDRPVFCPLERPCIWPEESDGRWRAWRIRDDGTGPVATEVQLGGVGDDWVEPDKPLRQVIGVWLDPTAPPLDELDRIRFEFVGNVPRRANDWSGHPLRARLRYVPSGVDTGGVTCHVWDSECWRIVPEADVQGLVITSDPPTFAKVVAPLDTVAGVPFPLRVIITDAWGNPSPVSGSFQPTLGGLPLGAPLVAAGQWSLATSVTVATAGLDIIDLELPAGLELTVAAQPTNTSEAGASPWRRLLGDLHIHSGSGAGAPAFAPTASVGDHSGGFTVGERALRYLDDVAGLDFGALSEHASRHAGWSLPAGSFADFEAGGPCAQDLSRPPQPMDWWRISQQAGFDYGALNPAFTTFPAFEWHSSHTRPLDKSPLHRVVVYRSFDTVTPHGLPMLPGETQDLPPQCLIRFLIHAGYTADQVLAIPHMMDFKSTNIDWELGFANPAGAALASVADLHAFMPVAEVFSARNFEYGAQGASMLRGAEGRDPDGSMEPYSVRYGWQLGARVGLVGASDNHSQMPGVNDEPSSDGSDAYHSHEPGGYTVALTDPQVATRDGIFDALGARRTYATSGERAWLEFTADADGTVVPMGSDLTGTCQIQFDAKLAAGRTIRRLMLVRSRLEPGALFVQVKWKNPDQRIASLSFREANPRAPGHGTGEWVYYIRAMLGPPIDPLATETETQKAHTDAVWSSPIFVTWPAACGTALSLDVGPIVPGSSTTFTATGAQPGALVAFVRGNTVGLGPCPAELSGMCLGLTNPVEMGRVTADAAGVAVLVQPVPLSAVPDSMVPFQAIEVAGPLSTRSRVERVRVGLYGLSDLFDEPTLDPSWSALNPGLMANWIDGSTLWLAPGPAAEWSDAATGPMLYKEITGDFSVSTTVRARSAADPAVPPVQPDEVGGLVIRAPGAPAEDWVSAFVGMGTSALDARHIGTDDGVSTTGHAPWPSGDAQVRLCREGSDLSAWWRETVDDPWVLAQTWSRPDLPATVQVGLAASAPSVAPDLHMGFTGVSFRDVTATADCLSET